MLTDSSILAWRIPWTEEPGGLESMGSQRIGHDLVTKPPPPPSMEFFSSNAKLGNQLTVSHLFSHTILWFNIAIYPHFTNEDTKTQQGQVMSLRHSNSVTEVVIRSSLQATYHLATKPALLS